MALHVAQVHEQRFGKRVAVGKAEEAGKPFQGSALGRQRMGLLVAGRVLTVEDAGGPLTVVFSGDLGRRDTPILRDPTPISHADFMANRPTGPQPKTTTVSPPLISPISAPW